MRKGWEVCPEEFTALSHTKKDRELECAGNGDENHEAKTVLAFFRALIEYLEGRSSLKNDP